jgi:hypothetical protein
MAVWAGVGSFFHRDRRLVGGASAPVSAAFGASMRSFCACTRAQMSSILAFMLPFVAIAPAYWHFTAVTPRAPSKSFASHATAKIGRADSSRVSSLVVRWLTRTRLGSDLIPEPDSLGRLPRVMPKAEPRPTPTDNLMGPLPGGATGLVTSRFSAVKLGRPGRSNLRRASDARGVPLRVELGPLRSEPRKRGCCLPHARSVPRGVAPAWRMVGVVLGCEVPDLFGVAGVADVPLRPHEDAGDHKLVGTRQVWTGVSHEEDACIYPD